LKAEDQNKFKALMYGLAEEYQQQFSNERLVLWWEQLKAHSYQEVAGAVGSCMRTCKFFPRLADIFEVLDPPKKASAHVAWQNLLSNLRCSSTGEDKVTQQVVRAMGGARKLAMMDEKDLRFKEKTFIELYDELSKETYKQSPKISLTSDEKFDANRLPVSNVMDISKQIH